MRILIYSPAFYPSIGGLETQIYLLAFNFVALNHEVKVITKVPDPQFKIFPFEIIRNPSPLRLLKEISWCNIYFQANISLKGLWPLLFVKKPWGVTHQGWYCRSDGHLGWQDYIKNYVVRFAYSVSASEAIAKNIPSHSIVIPNTYGITYSLISLESPLEKMYNCCNHNKPNGIGKIVCSG